MVALVPCVLVGVTPYLVYILIKNVSESYRLGSAAVVGTLTNTILFLILSKVQGYLSTWEVVEIGLSHGIPEIILSVIVVIPAVLLLRRWRAMLDNYHD